MIGNKETLLWTKRSLLHAFSGRTVQHWKDEVRRTRRPSALGRSDSRPCLMYAKRLCFWTQQRQQSFSHSSEYIGAQKDAVNRLAATPTTKARSTDLFILIPPRSPSTPFATYIWLPVASSESVTAPSYLASHLLTLIACQYILVHLPPPLLLAMLALERPTLLNIHAVRSFCRSEDQSYLGGGGIRSWSPTLSDVSAQPSSATGDDEMNHLDSEAPAVVINPSRDHYEFWDTRAQ